MNRRLQTALVVGTAVTAVIALAMPAALAQCLFSASHEKTHSTGMTARRHLARHHHRRRLARTNLARGAQRRRVTPTTRPTTKPTTTTPPVLVNDPTPIVIPPAPGAGSSSAKPPAGGYFATLPPGSALPSEAACAARVHRSSWEPRPENTTANHTAPTNPAALANFSQWNSTWNSTYKPRITGNFQGTTDEIIQWAACKWGWSDEVIRAEAVDESSWRQSTAGDGGNSFGLLQIKWNYHPAGPAKGAAGSSWPNSAKSTAYAVDQQVAEMRGCYDGMSTYLGNTKGDLWGCLQSWFSGAWTPGGGAYANTVKGFLNSKPWLGW